MPNFRSTTSLSRRQFRRNYSNYTPFRNQLISGGFASASSEVAARAYRSQTSFCSTFLQPFVQRRMPNAPSVDVTTQVVARPIVASQSTEHTPRVRCVTRARAGLPLTALGSRRPPTCTNLYILTHSINKSPKSKLLLGRR